jgi:hypothetical protein
MTTTDAAPLSGSVASTIGDMLDTLEQIERMKASLDAWRARIVDDARQWSQIGAGLGPERSGLWSAEVVAERELTSEIATALHIPERTAQTLVAHSRLLVHDLPATFDALNEGTISYRHAQVVADQASSLPDEGIPAFDVAASATAPNTTVAQFESRARRLREKMHPESLTVRAERARDDRCVALEPARDGMAWISALLPAERAVAVFSRLTDAAYALKTAEESRSIGQLRADVLSDLLIDGDVEAMPSGIRARVLVTVPVLTLLGGDAPASLEGYGPIDAETARVLAANAPSFTRLLTHPETGAVLSVGRDRYAVPADLRTWLRVRDETCRFPGCRNSAAHADIDHTHDWARDGQTAADNLAHLCKSHHHLKHHTRWTVTQEPGGVLEWTSPSQRVHVTRPANPPNDGDVSSARLLGLRI